MLYYIILYYIILYYSIYIIHYIIYMYIYILYYIIYICICSMGIYIYMWVHGFYDGKFQSLNLPARLDSQKAKDPLDPPSLMKK